MDVLKPPTLPPGCPWTAETLIGAGAMGQVWAGRDARTGAGIVVKTMHGHLPEGFEDRLRLEAEALAALHHEGIVQILGSGATVDRQPFLVMEHLQGMALDALLREHRWLPVAEAARICAVVASALGEVHARGMVHRDLKPANVFICQPGGRPKLLDFGIVKLIERVTGVAPLQVQTRHGSMLGTPKYVAPEQARGRAGRRARRPLFARGDALHDAYRRASVSGGGRARHGGGAARALVDAATCTLHGRAAADPAAARFPRAPSPREGPRRSAADGRTFRLV